MKKRILFFGAAALAVFAAAPFIGTELVPVSGIFTGSADETASFIFWNIRLPRTCVAFMAGSALALSGMAFQAMFRNPLSTPFTLGVSSGASLGASLYLRLGLGFSVLGITGLSISAFIGSLAAIMLVYSLTRMSRRISTATMLLAGVAVSFFFSSLILFLQYLSNLVHSLEILRWIMGGLSVSGYEDVLTVFPFVAAGILLIATRANELNLLATGDDLAASRGVDVFRNKQLIFFSTSLLVGGVVSICGPIGFIGMMVPHICRLIVGANHRYLIPSCILFGGMFLTLCDVISRTIIAPVELPVGIITALLGGPFFLWLLVKGGLK